MAHAAQQSYIYIDLTSILYMQLMLYIHNQIKVAQILLQQEKNEKIIGTPTHRKKST